jgi:polyisoprenoid-binding protein YceI
MKQLDLKIAVILIFLGFSHSMSGFSQESSDTLIYKLDINKSLLYWRADNHRGITKFGAGTIGVANKQLVEANITILMDSVRNVDIDYDLMRAVLENTIKSREILHVSKFPASYFNLCCSQRIAPDSLRVKGDLTVRDIPVCIDFKTFLAINDEFVIAESDTIAIDRTDWGIFAMSKNYGASEESYIVSDTIYIQISLTANQKVSVADFNSNE